ncbi:MAG TPA: FAD-dependent oxidoreductase [Micromonosporaceae bacterium]|jgi:3-phenylpropionate/trans-cinnamate dioxygenase ferredoxin reductase subunit|nr:FAD-dependent oxidoreductase [Micromonosporaceae bacterium]
MADDPRTFVIIGASLAGAKAAETLREEGFTGRVVLVGAETERPYERPVLSKGYLQAKDPRDKAYVHDAQWYADHAVELLLGRHATALDPAAHTVTLDDGELLGYDKLLLATGSRVRTLDVPGADAEGVRYLRTLEEADALLAAMRAGASVVVVGAGWIGLETAAAARTHGCSVAVVEVDSLPLRRVLGDEVAGIFRDLHVTHGVTFHFDTGVREIGDLDGRVASVVLDDSTELAADLVIVGVGIRPAVELAAAAGLRVDDGVVTDAALRTSDPDIYACGDVASSENPLLGKRIRVEHWANALNGGKAAARSMLGHEVVHDRVPYFFSDQYDLGMEYSGYVEPHGYDSVVFRGDPATLEFVAFWVSGGRVLAGMNVNVWDVVDPIQALVRAGYAGTAVDVRKLADPAVPLEDLLA